MVLPQAMAWVQYWFRVLSLKFCGKSKTICGDISQVSPAFCMYASYFHFLAFTMQWKSTNKIVGKWLRHVTQWKSVGTWLGETSRMQGWGGGLKTDRRLKLGFGRSLKFLPELTADAGWGRGWGAAWPIFHIFCDDLNFSPTFGGTDSEPKF